MPFNDLFPSCTWQASGVGAPQEKAKPAEGKVPAQQSDDDAGAAPMRADEPIVEMLEPDSDLETLLGLTKVRGHA